MVSIPDDLLARIDREVEARATSRSGLLQAAALRELGRPDPAAIDAALAAGRAALEGSGSFESSEAVRAGRDALADRDRRRI
jgi:hypothetical protein